MVPPIKFEAIHGRLYAFVIQMLLLAKYDSKIELRKCMGNVQQKTNLQRNKETHTAQSIDNHLKLVL